MTTSQGITTGERTDFLQMLAKHRGFLRKTVEGLTDEQAARTPTVSALSVAGLIKHVADVEAAWTRFALGGAELMESVPGDWVNGFRMVEGETLAGLLAKYEEIASRTDELVTTLDLDESHPLPVAPWFEAGASWSNRRVLMHIIAETSQHAGHADIIRETIDGSKSMG